MTCVPDKRDRFRLQADLFCTFALHFIVLLMFLDKIRRRESGVLLYGITPPKAETPYERVCEIAARNISRLAPQDIDALIVYDVQDEAERTSEERPFPFTKSLDPLHYASQHLRPLEIPKILYRAAVKFTKEELSQWLMDLNAQKAFPVFVGSPTPDFVPITTLQEAYGIWRKDHAADSVIGAVTIPERHAILKDEDVRMLDKISSGVSYFVSQCIFNVEFAKQMLSDLAATCEKRNVQLPTVIFTLTICGSPKTLQFMEWLGIHIPDDMKAELKSSENQLTRSVEIVTSIARELIVFCKQRNIPCGFNIESVAIRKEEIEASFGVLGAVRQLLVDNGLRKNINGQVSPAARQPAVK
jgi:hypothetical protein